MNFPTNNTDFKGVAFVPNSIRSYFNLLHLFVVSSSNDEDDSFPLIFERERTDGAGSCGLHSMMTRHIVEWLSIVEVLSTK